jgi:hypothetical protein
MASYMGSHTKFQIRDRSGIAIKERKGTSAQPDPNMPGVDIHKHINVKRLTGLISDRLLANLKTSRGDRSPDKRLILGLLALALSCAKTINYLHRISVVKHPIPKGSYRYKAVTTVYWTGMVKEDDEQK